MIVNEEYLDEMKEHVREMHEGYTWKSQGTEWQTGQMFQQTAIFLQILHTRFLYHENAYPQKHPLKKSKSCFHRKINAAGNGIRKTVTIKAGLLPYSLKPKKIKKIPIIETKKTNHATYCFCIPGRPWRFGWKVKSCRQAGSNPAGGICGD